MPNAPLDPLPPSLAQPLATVIARAPVSCAPDTALRAALASMHAEGIGAMVVVDATGAPLGIFTLRDVLARVTLAERSLDEPVRAIMTGRVFSLPPQEIGRAHV